MQIVQLNNLHVLQVNDGGVLAISPTNTPRWPNLLTGAAAYHEIVLTLAIPGANSLPMSVKAFDLNGQLVGAAAPSNTFETVRFQSLGYPIQRVELKAPPNQQGGIISINGQPNYSPLIEPLNQCADYRFTTPGPVPNPWPQSGFTLTSSKAVGGLEGNTFIEDGPVVGPGDNGYHVQFSTEILFATNCCRRVQIELVQTSGLVDVVAYDSSGAILGTYRLEERGVPATVNLGPFRAPVCRVVITAPNDLTRILKICCVPVAQTDCLPPFQVGTNSNPFTIGHATFQVITGAPPAPAATRVLMIAGFPVLDLGTETLATLSPPCDRIALEVISDGPGGMEIEAADEFGLVISRAGPLPASAAPQPVVLTGPGIKTIRFKSPNGKGYLVNLCCLPK